MNHLAVLVSRLFLSANREIKGEAMRIILQMLDCTDERSAAFIYYAFKLFCVIAEEASTGDDALLIEVIVLTYARIQKIVSVIGTSACNPPAEGNIPQANDGIMKGIAKFINQCVEKLSFSVLSGGVDICEEFALVCAHNNLPSDSCSSFDLFCSTWSDTCTSYMEQCTVGGAGAVSARLAVLSEMVACLKLLVESFPAQVTGQDGDCAEDDAADRFHHRIVRCSLELLKVLKGHWCRSLGGGGSSDSTAEVEQLAMDHFR
jgi:hypothetical protein